ncbi:MAG: protease modulator HflC [Planctomycetes bacterium]|nr:protease modulator HflC [Planctomycetota bacterium]
MKHRGIVIVAGVLVLLLLVYMFTFQVRFNEVAVVTTFGRAKEGSVLNTDGQGAGLHFKWPWPVQECRRFDTRLQLTESLLEEVYTKDNQNLVVHTFVSWRIADPLAFFQKLGSEKEAEKQLQSRLREAKAVLGDYAFDDLTNVEPAKLKLGDAEKRLEQRLRDSVEKNGYGIELRSVGFKRLVLPEQVTKKVFERQIANRKRLAESARSEGKAEANRITSDAQTSADRILAFAQLKADAIRAEGDAAAVQYYEVYKNHEDLAVFLRQIDALKKTLKSNTTLLLDTGTIPMNLLDPKKASGEAK